MKIYSSQKSELVKHQMFELAPENYFLKGNYESRTENEAKEKFL